MRPAPLDMSVPAHQYPTTRDSFSPLVDDLPAMGVATLAFDERDLSHVTARVVPGDAHAMAIYFDVWDELLAFVRRALVLG